MTQIRQMKQNQTNQTTTKKTGESDIIRQIRQSQTKYRNISKETKFNKPKQQRVPTNAINYQRLSTTIKKYQQR